MARKILLADDSVTAQNMGRKILADAGYDVITVNNGSAALKRITEIKPDLIVLDVYMPGYSGLEVCQRLKESAETSHIPVLLTVGKLEPFKPEEARRVKADAHIVKPFEASELLTAITRLEDRMVPQQARTVQHVGFWRGAVRREEQKNVTRQADGYRMEEPPAFSVEEEKGRTGTGAGRDDFGTRRSGISGRERGRQARARAFAVKARAMPEQEPALVPDIPRDITPEELDALSALAAKLDGPVAIENAAPVEEKTDPVEAPVAEVAAEVAATEVAGKTIEAETPAPVADVTKAEEEAEEKKEQVEVPVPPPAEIVEVAAPAVEAPALAVEVQKEVESPVEHVEPASEVAAVAVPPAAVVATLLPTR